MHSKLFIKSIVGLFILFSFSQIAAAAAAPSTQLTYGFHIYLTNNTPNKVSIQTFCGKLSADQCNAKSTAIIKPYQRIELMEPNYFFKPGSDDTYHLGLTAINNENNAELNVKLDLTPDFPGSYFSKIKLNNDESIRTLLPLQSGDKKISSNTLGSADLPTWGKKYTFYVDAQQDRANTQSVSSIYMVINAPPKVESSQDEPKQLSLLTYNTQMFPSYIKVALDLNKPKAREKEISHQLAQFNYDVVVFEEAWDNGIRADFKKDLGKAYPFNYDPPIKNKDIRNIVKLNSGLLIFSKWKITKFDFLNFNDNVAPTGSDQMANKGIAYIQINKKGKTYHIFATHTQAQEDPTAIKVRQQQLLLINKFIAKQKIPKNEPVILMGDMNTDKFHTKQYQYMTKNLNAVSYKNQNKSIKYTTYPKINLMYNYSTPEMVDYILSIKGYQMPKKVNLQIMPIRGADNNAMYQLPVLNAIFKLYHYGDIETSDHFPVQASFQY